MMHRFHDAEHTKKLRQQISHDKTLYEWSVVLTDVLQGYPEWYIPTLGAEVLMRGISFVMINLSREK